MQAELFRGNPEEWDEFVAGQPDATASHLYGWRRVIERTYQHDCPYLVAREGGRIAGVLPLVDVRSIAFGRFLVSMPFLNAGGPIGSPAAVQALLARAVELGQERRARLLELRAGRPLETSLDDHTEKVECVLALAESADSVWTGFPAKLRSQIRRPQKANMEVRFGAAEIDAFFGVFARNMRDLGSPTHPVRFFRVLAEELPDHALFGCVYHEGKAVAGGCAVHWRNEIEMTWASSLREFSNLAPNMLLYWAFIERATAAGLQRFNFGRCTPESGSHRFKMQWGPVDTPLHWYRAPLRAGAGTPKQEGGLSLATRIWQRVPVPLATMVGGRLRGGIPS
ncbi:MAG TPA: FemAB family XrtA/PEP-CTERM system-associated protein [Longimicrobiales bacterium]